MAYFPNGTAGMLFEDKWCSRCVHQNGPDGKTGCAVWLTHLLYSYQLCNAKEDEGKQMLDLLIPEDAEGFPSMCAMFHQGPAVPDPSTLPKPTVMPAMKEWAKKHGIPA